MGRKKGSDASQIVFRFGLSAEHTGQPLCNGLHTPQHKTMQKIEIITPDLLASLIAGIQHGHSLFAKLLCAGRGDVFAGLDHTWAMICMYEKMNHRFGILKNWSTSREGPLLVI
jgi:hypothetical protein